MTMARRVGQPASQRRGEGKVVPKPRTSAKSTPSSTLPRLLYSITEAAQVLGIPRRTAYVLVQRGIIPTIDDYGRKMVPAKLLERDVERRVQLALAVGTGLGSRSRSGDGTVGTVGDSQRRSA